MLAVFDINGDAKEALAPGEEGVIVLDRTPFYAESGGQVGDYGQLVIDNSSFVVKDTQISGDQRLHIGSMSADSASSISAGTAISASVDADIAQKDSG